MSGNVSSPQVIQVTARTTDVQDSLNEVRQLSEFSQGGVPQNGNSFWDDLLRSLDQQLTELFQAISEFLNHILPFLQIPDIQQGPAISIWQPVIKLLFIVSTAVLAVILVVVIYRYLRKKLSPIKTGKKGSLYDIELQSSRHHLSKAQEHSKAGEYEDALRQLYLSALCLLAEKNVVPFLDARTNLEYAIQLSNTRFITPDHHEQSVSSFKNLMKQFERYYYGGYRVEKDDFNTSMSAFENLSDTIDHIEVVHHVK